MEVKNGSMIQLSLFHEEEEKSIHIGLILEEKKKMVLVLVNPLYNKLLEICYMTFL